MAQYLKGNKSIRMKVSLDTHWCCYWVITVVELFAVLLVIEIDENRTLKWKLACYLHWLNFSEPYVVKNLPTYTHLNQKNNDYYRIIWCEKDAHLWLDLSLDLCENFADIWLNPNQRSIRQFGLVAIQLEFNFFTDAKRYIKQKRRHLRRMSRHRMIS